MPVQEQENGTVEPSTKIAVPANNETAPQGLNNKTTEKNLGTVSEETDPSAVVDTADINEDGSEYNFIRSENIPQELRAFSEDGGIDFYTNLVKEYQIKPKEAQEILDKIDAYSSTLNSKYQELIKEKEEQSIKVLEEELGGKSKLEATLANVNALLESAGVTEEELKGSGLANNANLVRILSRIQKLTSEDVAVGTNQVLKQQSTEAVMDELNRLKGGIDSPYYNARHPDHVSTVKKVTELMSKF